MAISLDERIVTFTKGARRIPPLRGDRAVHPSCLYRWAKTGLGGVRLETIQVGGTLCTSVEALERFFHALASRNDTRSTEAERRDAATASAARKAEDALASPRRRTN